MIDTTYRLDQGYITFVNKENLLRILVYEDYETSLSMIDLDEVYVQKVINTLQEFLTSRKQNPDQQKHQS